MQRTFLSLLVSINRRIFFRKYLKPVDCIVDFLEEAEEAISIINKRLDAAGGRIEDATDLVKREIEQLLEEISSYLN